jgi:hypothetical protein
MPYEPGYVMAVIWLSKFVCFCLHLAKDRLSSDTIEALICLQDWMRIPSPDLLVLQVVAPPVSILV